MTDLKVSRPFPSWSTLLQTARCFDQGGQQRVEFALDDFRKIIRCFVECVPFDENSYIAFNPSLSSLPDVRQHWLAHGYFEGRVQYGWENLTFDLHSELLRAPDQYFSIVTQANIAMEQRRFHAAELRFKDAIRAFANGATAYFCLGELYLILRRPTDSILCLRRALELRPGPRKLYELLMDALSDIGQHEEALKVGLSTKVRDNTAKQVLRLLNAGHLRAAKIQVALANDDWPTVMKLRDRIGTEWEENRKHLSFLIKKHRRESKGHLQDLVDIAICLTKFGFRNKSVAVLREISSSGANLSTLYQSIDLLIRFIDAIKITEGYDKAFDFIEMVPAELRSDARVERLWISLAYESTTDRMRRLYDKVLKVQSKNKFTEAWCQILIVLGHLDEALEICRVLWPDVVQYRWAPAVVMQVGRLNDSYEGLSMDEDIDVAYEIEIPRRIMQFWDKKIPPDDVTISINSWRDKNIEFEHVLFSEEEAVEFLRHHYDDEFVALYSFCHHPAMRADFFRVAYLVKMGGAYVDADEYCNAPIGQLLSHHKSKKVFASISQDQFFINNRFLVAVASDRYLQRVLDCIVEDLRMSMAVGGKPDIWFTTGPWQYSRVFAESILNGGGPCTFSAREIGLVYAKELSQYVGQIQLKYKNTKEGNWRA